MLSAQHGEDEYVDEIPTSNQITMPVSADCFNATIIITLTL